MVGKFTGIAGTTVFTAKEGHRRLQARSEKRQGRPGRGADRRMGDELAQITASYEDHVAPLAPGDRPCTATSLLNFPGRLTSGKLDKDGHRTGEVLQDGSCRLFVRPDLRSTLERVTRYGLVLSHQAVITRPAGTAVHDRDISVIRGEPARPLSDAIMTAIILATGPLPDGPLADIDCQLIKQSTAQQLWDVAVRQVGSHLPVGAQLQLNRSVLQSVRNVLREALPQLLRNDAGWIEALEGALPIWAGKLTDLAEELPVLVNNADRINATRSEGDEKQCWQLPLF